MPSFARFDPQRGHMYCLAAKSGKQEDRAEYEGNRDSYLFLPRPPPLARLSAGPNPTYCGLRCGRASTIPTPGPANAGGGGNPGPVSLRLTSRLGQANPPAADSAHGPLRA